MEYVIQKKGYTTKILLYEKSENVITQCSVEKNKKRIDDLYKIKSFVNESKPDIKAVLIIFPYSEIFEEWILTDLQINNSKWNGIKELYEKMQTN